jgi:uncharacterized protein (DUF924 family)
MSMNEGFEDVLRFWFSSLPHGDHAEMVRQMEWWFRGGADSEIIQQFPQLLERAARGEFDSWSQSPRSRLALIIVLDQFSRTIHRGAAQAFAQDPKALGLALEGIEIGHYAALETPWEKTFFFLPLGLRGSGESGTVGQTRGGTRERGLTRTARPTRFLRESSPRPSRRNRSLRPSPAPQRNPRATINSRGTRVPRDRAACSHPSAAGLVDGKKSQRSHVNGCCS